MADTDDNATDDQGGADGQDQNNQQGATGDQGGQGTQGAQGDTDTGADSGQDTGKTYTQAELERLVEQRLIRERKKYTGFTDLQKKAAEYDKLQEKNKTEQERLNDQLAAAQVELQTYRVEKVRRAAADAAGDPTLWEFITETDSDKAEEQAKRLAARFGTPPQDGNNGQPPRRANLQQGTRAQPPPEMTRDQLLRGLAAQGR